MKAFLLRHAPHLIALSMLVVGLSGCVSGSPWA